jgi:hypothetical protein
MNKYKAVKRYYWKELSDDGLLNDPESSNCESINRRTWHDSGFETEEEAVERYIKLKEDDEWWWPSSLVLICEYKLEEI